MKSGATSYIVKPIAFADLKKRIAQALDAPAKKT
jgi:DNA-binding response OmpR family regulator